MNISLKLFGAYRPLGDEITLQVDKPEPMISDLRRAFSDAIGDNMPLQTKEALLNSSRFADEKSVLSEEAPLQEATQYAVLPPVSGG